MTDRTYIIEYYRYNSDGTRRLESAESFSTFKDAVAAWKLVDGAFDGSVYLARKYPGLSVTTIDWKGKGRHHVEIHPAG